MADIRLIGEKESLVDGKQKINDSLTALNIQVGDHETRIDNIVGSAGSSNTEIVDARYDGVNAVTYPLLKDRLDEQSNQIGISSKKTNGILAITEYENLVSTGNWLPALQEAIDDATANNFDVWLENKNISISGELYLKANVKLYGGTITFSNTSRIFMTGENTTVEDVTLEVGTYGTLLQGNIEFLDSTNAKINRVKIKGNHNGTAVFCKSRANDTFITNLTVQGIGWGILFDDMETARGAGYRTINGTNYNGASVGSGLFIDRFIFDPGTSIGDGIEINLPEYSFTKVVVTNSLVKKTNKTSGNGIGFGFANCVDVSLSNCKVYNCALDGIHFELGSHHTINNCHVNGAYRGYSIGGTKNSKMTNCTALNCNYWVVSYNIEGSGTLGEDVIFEGNTFDTCTEFGLLISNGKFYRIKNNTFKNYSGNNNALLQFYNAGSGHVFNSVIEDNYFIKGTGTTTLTTVVSIATGSENNIFKNNTFDGYNTFAVSIDTTKNRYENYVRGNPTGLHLLVNGDPNGYFNGSTGNIAVDATNGVVYRKTSASGNTGWKKVTNEFSTGSAVFSGDGAITQFTFAHGLSAQPSFVGLSPTSVDCGNAEILRYSSDATNVTVYFKTAPIAGTNNVTFRWRTEI